MTWDFESTGVQGQLKAGPGIRQALGLAAPSYLKA